MMAFLSVFGSLLEKKGGRELDSSLSMMMFAHSVGVIGHNDAYSLRSSGSARLPMQLSLLDKRKK